MKTSIDAPTWRWERGRSRFYITASIYSSSSAFNDPRHRPLCRECIDPPLLTAPELALAPLQQSAGTVGYHGVVFDLNRADPLYSANQERKYTPSADIIGQVSTYQVEYFWHRTVQVRRPRNGAFGRTRHRVCREAVMRCENGFQKDFPAIANQSHASFMDSA